MAQSEQPRRCYISFLPDSGEFELVFEGLTDLDVAAAKKTLGENYLSITIRKVEAIRLLHSVAAGLIIDATGEMPPGHEPLVM